MTGTSRGGSKAGRVSLDLVATVRSRLGAASHDDLATTDGLARWLNSVELSTTDSLEHKDIETFGALRESIYRLLGTVAKGGDERPRDSDIALVNKHARGRTPVAGLRFSATEAALNCEIAPPTVAEALAVVARDAVDLLTGPERDRLHQCQAEVCGSFFLDTSRAGQRRWCSSASCGNRLRVAAHRERHRADITS